MSKYFEAARVGSWIGWAFNFGFGSVLFGQSPFEITAIVLFAFSLATGSVFVLNQYFDSEADRENEVKSNLPVASGRITPRKTLVFSFLLVLSCLILVSIANVQVLPLFIVYLGLWTAYSTPPLRLKSVPVADFVISGIGAGFLPFSMGSGLTDKLFSRIPLIMLGAMPLILIQSGGHIIQAVGDYEADRKTGVHTFVVRYGKKKGVALAGFMFLIAGVLPFVYLTFGLLPYRHLLFLSVLCPLSIPIIMRYADMLRNPSTKNVINMQKTTRKYGIIGVTVILAYALFVKIAGF
jgi:4-hydroxybenzoate polyprenyltransferase